MSFGSDDPQVSEVVGGVYSEAEPYISDIMTESARLYGSDVGRNYYPGSTVVDFSPQTRSALDLQKAQGFDMTGGSNYYDLAAGSFGGMASGAAGDSYMNRGLGAGMGSAYANRGLGMGYGSADPGRDAYSEIQPQGEYLSSVRSGILSDVMQDVQSSFGGQGRTGTSPGAQQAVARGFTQEYAPIAQSAAEAERARELDSRESAIGRQFTGGREAMDRLYQGSQADMTREQQARAAQLSRQYGSSQADIAREQSAREAMFGRMGTGAEGISNIQDLYDRRRMAGVGAIGETGAAYEDLAGRTLQDRINRYEFEQRSPYDRLNSFMSPILSIGSFNNPSYEYSGGGSRFGSALGGAQAGYNLGNSFGMGGYGAILGGLGGLLG
jgi:hypothetical protein